MVRRLLASAAAIALLSPGAFAQSPAARSPAPLQPSPLSAIPQGSNAQGIDRQPLAPPAMAPPAAAPQPAAPPPIEWEDIVGAEGRYRLQMPDDYQYLEAQPEPGGPMFHQYSVAYPGRFGLQLMINDRSGPPDEAADVAARLLEMQADLQRSWPGATVLEQKPIQLGSVPGRTFTLSVDRGQSVVMVRLYYTEQALYTQLCVAPITHRKDPAVIRFFDSLRVS